MHIKRLELENFRGFAKASVSFPEENVAVFFGGNGSGKTAVLDAAAILLSAILNDEAPGYSKNYSALLSEDDIKIGEKRVNLQAHYLLENQERHVKTSLSGGHIVSGSNNSEDLSKNIDLPVFIYYRTDRHYKPATEQISNGDDRSSHSNGRWFGYYDALNTATTDFSSFRDWFRYQEDLENQQKIEKRDFNWENPNLKSIRDSLLFFLSKMDADFTGLKVQRQSNEKIDFLNPSNKSELHIQKAGQEIKLTQLSSGERALILLVADIARRASILNPELLDSRQSRGVVIIDEIELHLHPKWQRAVIPALQATFPNIQFIIATHSPQVLSEVENGAVFEIENFQIQPRNTYGRDNEWVLHVIMEDEERPKEVQEMLEQYFALIRTDHLTEAARLRQQIEEKIGTDEPELVKADILLRRKERALAS